MFIQWSSEILVDFKNILNFERHLNNSRCRCYFLRASPLKSIQVLMQVNVNKIKNLSNWLHARDRLKFFHRQRRRHRKLIKLLSCSFLSSSCSSCKTARKVFLLLLLHGHKWNLFWRFELEAEFSWSKVFWNHFNDLVIIIVVVVVLRNFFKSQARPQPKK